MGPIGRILDLAMLEAVLHPRGPLGTGIDVDGEIEMLEPGLRRGCPDFGASIELDGAANYVHAPFNQRLLNVRKRCLIF